MNRLRENRLCDHRATSSFATTPEGVFEMTGAVEIDEEFQVVGAAIAVAKERGRPRGRTNPLCRDSFAGEGEGIMVRPGRSSRR